MTQARFDSSDLERAVMRESELEGAKFSSCNLGGVDFRKANVLSASFESVAVNGALFYGKPPWDGDAEKTDWGSIMPTFDGE